MLRKFNPPGASPPPFYSHGAEVSGAPRMLFISGQVGVRTDGSVGEGIAEQTQIAVENLQAVLSEAGMDVGDIAKLGIYLTDEASMAGFASAAVPLLSTPPAATTLLIVKALASPGLLIEIEAVAVR
jgi:2-iminobutanoate/2-iminopropanoate deaminase